MSYIAAVLLVIVAAAHSFLGEIFLIKPLLKSDALPHLRGNRRYTERLVRVAWHITTLAWLGFAAMFVLLAKQAISPQSVAAVMAVTFLLTGLIALVTSKGRHLSWVIFLTVGFIAAYVSTA